MIYYRTYFLYFFNPLARIIFLPARLSYSYLRAWTGIMVAARRAG